MDTRPVYQAAAEAAGVDLNAEEIPVDDIRKIQDVLRKVDAYLGNAIGDEIVINVKYSRSS